MKKLLLVAMLASLSGCSLLTAYRMAHFDNNEYMLINGIHTQASVAVSKCGTFEVTGAVDSIYFSSLELKNYSASIPHNEATIKMTDELVVITKELSDRYYGTEEVSATYCKLKFNLIEKNAITMQKVIGSKPRWAQ